MSARIFPSRIFDFCRTRRLKRALIEMTASSQLEYLVREDICTWVSKQRLKKESNQKKVDPQQQEYIFSYWSSGENLAPPIVQKCLE